ncbi:MAG: hypothetical protein ACE5IH_07780 [Thermodesulfobacteriota bacterium]
MKVLRVVTLLWLVVSLSNVAYAEAIDFNRLYGLRDKKELEEIIRDASDAIKENPSDKDNLKVLGIAYHNLGILEVKGAPTKGVEYLEKAYQLSPDDYEILAYLGSAKTMVARDSWNVITKVSQVNKGANMMDKAVRKAPENIAVRMVRANNSLALPKFFNRRHLARRDFLAIERLIGKDASSIDSDTKAEVFYQLGMIYKDEKDNSKAIIYFKKAVTAGPDSKWAMRAREELR